LIDEDLHAAFEFFFSRGLEKGGLRRRSHNTADPRGIEEDEMLTD